MPISTGGGRAPAWSRDGRELIYRNESAVLAVDIETEPTLRVGIPQVLFEGAYERDAGAHPRYDVSADGERLLMAQGASVATGGVEIQVVLNWFEELEARVPIP